MNAVDDHLDRVIPFVVRRALSQETVGIPLVDERADDGYAPFPARMSRQMPCTALYCRERAGQYHLCQRQL